MKFLIFFVIFTLFIESDTTKVDSAKVRSAAIDTSLIRMVKQREQISNLYAEQSARIDSIRIKLRDPKVVKKLRKKFKK